MKKILQATAAKAAKKTPTATKAAKATKASKAAKTAAIKRAKAAAKTTAEHVVLLGGGRMGADIAMAFAMHGWQCDVVEPSAAMRARAGKYWSAELKRLRTASSLRNLRLHPGYESVEWSSADLVVEAVPEDLKLKHAILKKVEPLVRAKTIIATNTSSLPISDIMRVLDRPERGGGFHLSLPAHLMLAVEITKGDKSSAATMKKLVKWTEALGKVPIVVRRDVPGMLINRLQHAMYREIYHLIETGVATPHDIDCAVRFGFGFKYNLLGPLISRDIHGVPIHLTTARQLYPTLYNGNKPGKLLTGMVAKGNHGVTTGRGFYEWPKETTSRRLDAFASMLGESLKQIKRLGMPSGF